MSSGRRDLKLSWPGRWVRAAAAIPPLGEVPTESAPPPCDAPAAAVFFLSGIPNLPFRISDSIHNFDEVRGVETNWTKISIYTFVSVAMTSLRQNNPWERLTPVNSRSSPAVPEHEHLLRGGPQP